MFLTLALASPSVRDIRAQRQREFEDKLEQLIDERNLDGLVTFLDGNIIARYSHFEDLEIVLLMTLQVSDYEIATILLDSGVRINEHLQEVLVKLIVEGERTVLAKILELQPVSVTVFCDYEELMKIAVERGDFTVFEILLSQGNLINQCTNQSIARISKLALQRGQREILNSILEISEKALKRLLLGSLLKISANRENFYIVQMCADEDISFKGLEHEAIWEISKIAAEIGCERTTRALFRVFSIAAYIKRRLNQETDNPLEIAKSRRNDEIVLLYENFI